VTDVRVTVEGAEAAELRLRASAQSVAKALDSTAVEIEDLVEAGAGAHAKTGALERSIFKVRVTGGWEIGHDSQVAPYARFVHDGTRPHIIRPRARRVLRWPVPGGFAFAKAVDHPGYKGDAWLRRAAREALPIFERVLNARLQGV
jgi:hypothetical protein